jgi:outer membrane protein W
MKKTFIVISLITNALCNLSAQIQKGSWIIDGGLRIAQNPMRGRPDFRMKYDESSADAEVGYFFSDRLVAGVKSGAEFTDYTTVWDNQLGSNNSNQLFYITPFARFFFNPASKLKTFYELNLQSSWSRHKVNSNAWSNNLGITVSNKIGADYFLTNNIALEGSLNYVYFSAKSEQGSYSLPKFVLNPEFTIKLFLNTQKQEANVLAEKYLKKGNVTVGLTGYARLGNFSYGGFIPYIGYFLTDKWMISSSLHLSAGSESRYLSLIPELRYYHPVTPSMQFMLRGAAAMGVYHRNWGTPKTEWGGQFIEAGIGLNQFVSENISIQATTNLQATGDYNNQLIISPNVKIGFQYFMNR